MNASSPVLVTCLYTQELMESHGMVLVIFGILILGKHMYSDRYSTVKLYIG